MIARVIVTPKPVVNDPQGITCTFKATENGNGPGLAQGATATASMQATGSGMAFSWYLIGGTASCYGIALEYRRYLVFVPEEKTDWSYGISVSLKNIGTTRLH